MYKKALVWITSLMVAVAMFPAFAFAAGDDKSDDDITMPTADQQSYPEQQMGEEDKQTLKESVNEDWEKNMRTAGNAQWESESNDYIGSANNVSIATGNSINGYTVDDDIDFFKFSISQGSEIKFSVYSSFSQYLNNGSYDLHYKIYSSGDITQPVISSGAKYNRNLGYVHEDEIRYLPAGTYYLKVYSYFDNSYTYKFSFTTTGYESFNEPNNYIGQATPVSSGKIYYGLLADNERRYDYMTSNDGDDDFFKVASTKGGYYYVTTFAYNGLYINAYNGLGDERNIFYDSYWCYRSFLEIDKGKRVTKLVKLPKGNTYMKLNYNNPGKYKFSVTSKPGKITGVKVSKKSKTSIKVKWTKKSGITGYKVYRSTKKSSGYKCIKTITNAKTNYYIDKKKKKGKRYYYKICSYKTVNGYACKGYYSTASSKVL